MKRPYVEIGNEGLKFSKGNETKTAKVKVAWREEVKQVFCSRRPWDNLQRHKYHTKTWSFISTLT